MFILEVLHWKKKLTSLKTEFDKSDIYKLVPVLVDLCKLSDVVKNGVDKKTDYDKLVAKVNGIDTSGVLKKLSMIQINQN